MIYFAAYRCYPVQPAQLASAPHHLHRSARVQLLRQPGQTDDHRSVGWQGISAVRAQTRIQVLQVGDKIFKDGFFYKIFLIVKKGLKTEKNV